MKKLLAILSLLFLLTGAGPSPCYWSGSYVRCFPSSGLAISDIQFPATQVASADANTLDDYEEGTWSPTPALAAGGTPAFTYSSQVGTYTKIGRVVHFQVKIIVSGWGGGGPGNVNAVTITGLPFPAQNTTGMSYGVTVGYFANINVAVVSLMASIDPNTSVINLFKLTAAAGSPTALTVDNVGTTMTLIVSGTYFTAT